MLGDEETIKCRQRDTGVTQDDIKLLFFQCQLSGWFFCLFFFFIFLRQWMALRCNRQAQLVKTPAAEASRPEFNPPGAMWRGGRGKGGRTDCWACPLTSTHVYSVHLYPTREYCGTCTHAHTFINDNDNDDNDNNNVVDSKTFMDTSWLQKGHVNCPESPRDVQSYNWTNIWMATLILLCNDFLCGFTIMKWFYLIQRTI